MNVSFEDNSRFYEKNETRNTAKKKKYIYKQEKQFRMNIAREGYA